MAMAVAELMKNSFSRIILTRPAVEAGEKLGFLPGDLAEKVNPYLRPLYDALHDMVDFDRARKLVERGGLDNLTMRGLADELGVSTAVAYYHVPNKEALLHLVADAVLGRVPLPDPAQSWDEQLRQVLWNQRTQMLRYPGISQVLASPPVLPQCKRVGDGLDDILVGAGFDEDAAAMGVTMLAVYVLGHRIWLGPHAASHGLTTEAVIKDVVERVAIP